MKNIYIILFLSCNSLALSGQDYFHKIIDYPQGIPTISQVVQEGSVIHIAALNGFGNTIVTSLNTNSLEPEFKQIDSVSSSRDGLSVSGDTTFIYAKNRSIIDNQEFIIFIGDQTETIDVNTTIEGQYVWPIAYNASEGFHYLGYDTKIDSLDKSTFGIQKRSSNGDLIWEHYYGIDNGFNSVDEIGIAANGDILSVGIARRIPPNLMNRTQLLLFRISPDGSLINTFLQEETSELGERAMIAPLLNNHVITNVNVDRIQDWDFFINDWYPFPDKLHWVNENGNQYKEKLIITDRPNELYLANIVPSKYFEHFFLVGLSYNADEAIDYGYISKISYTGETLWERKYAHPDFFFGSNALLFNDVLEQENGDIYAFGKAGVVNGEKDIWIMKVNADGCFGDGGNCGETVVTTGTKDIQAYDQPILYPNPATSVLNIDNLSSDGKEVKVKLLDLNGALLKSISTDDLQIQLDIENLSAGMHLIEIEYQDGRKMYKKFIKIE